MKKLAITVVIVSFIFLVGCQKGDINTQNSQGSETSSSLTTDNSSRENVTSDSRITYTEDKMPTNDSEDQVYVDKYIAPYSVTGMFSKNFSTGNFTEIDNMLTIFNAFAVARPDNDLNLSDEESTLPQEVVEDILMSHLEITSEEIRSICSQFYDAETKTYTNSYGLGGGDAAFVITDSKLEEDTLSLTYDFFTGDDKNPTDTFRFVLSQKGKMEIKIYGDDFKFISNTIEDVYGRE